MRVLVIDDNADFRHLTEKVFEAFGHTVEVQPSAFGVVNRVAGAFGPAPDLVVLDCDLPGLTGRAAVELLAKDRRTQMVPVLLMSAADTAANRAAALTHTRGIFLKKDGHLRALVQKAEQLVAAVPAGGPAPVIEKS